MPTLERDFEFNTGVRRFKRPNLGKTERPLTPRLEHSCLTTPDVTGGRLP
jgi:hypothetical protein